MKKVLRHSALALTIAAVCNPLFAANHPASFGSYRTAVQEDRLFIEDGTLLRCNLFFSSGGSQDEVVAPRGSRVSQSVPPFVWQYSGLLPVSEYLKTAAIHSSGSQEKERAWQDVQLTFYNGLRVEGAREFEAKIAYAGAYAFAPRWPLANLIDITDPQRDKDSRLYKVEYISANPKGITIDEYRTLVQDIQDNAGDISLEDIRGVIDAADAARASSGDDDSWLKKIWSSESTDDAKMDKKLAKMAGDDHEGSSSGNGLGQLFVSEQSQEAAGQLEQPVIADSVVVEIPAEPEEEQLQLAMNDEPVDGEVVDLSEVIEEANVDLADQQLASEGEEVAISADAESPETKSDSESNRDPETNGDLESDENEASEGVVVILDDVATDESFSDQLTAADQTVLEDITQTENQATADQDEGVVVDLDSILIEDQRPAELDQQAEQQGDVNEVFGDEKADAKEESMFVEVTDEAGETGDESEQEEGDKEGEWVVMPDGTEVLKF